MANELISKIQTQLENNADEKTRESTKRFFKEKVISHGDKSTVVDQIAKLNFPKDKTKKEIFALCEELFKTSYMEESWVACNWSYRLKSDYTKEDFLVFESWLHNYVSNWATCDTLCNHTIGEFLEKFPEFVEKLIGWTKSDNRWVKRGSAVSLIIPARKGKFQNEIFHIADNLLLDPDDLVQKGYGWLLKAASQFDQKAVYDYVMKNKSRMPRTALRYAIEKMPPDLRTKLMTK